MAIIAPTTKKNTHFSCLIAGERKRARRRVLGWDVSGTLNCKAEVLEKLTTFLECLCCINQHAWYVSGEGPGVEFKVHQSYIPAVIT